MVSLIHLMLSFIIKFSDTSCDFVSISYYSLAMLVYQANVLILCHHVCLTNKILYLLNLINLYTIFVVNLSCIR